MQTKDLFDPSVPYSEIRKNDLSSLLDIINTGFEFNTFRAYADTMPFNHTEWCSILGIADKYIRAYKITNEVLQRREAEKVLLVVLFYKQGLEIFGNAEAFHSWLNKEHNAYGMAPRFLMDTYFGIMTLREELTTMAA